MARPKSSNRTTVRTLNLKIRVNELEMATANLNAIKAGMTVCNYVRSLIMADNPVIPTQGSEQENVATSSVGGGKGKE